MVVRRHVHLILFIGAMSLVLSQFQNCAPAGMQSPSTSPASNVKIVDEYGKAEIEFISSEIQVHDEASIASVDGLCNREHSGAQLRWAVYAGSLGTRPLDAGLSQCRMGGFRVDLSALEKLDCGVNHLLVVEGDWGGSTFANFSKRCQPLVSEPVATPDSSPMGTQCSLEYSPATAISGSCVEVCYRDSKVVRAQPVEGNRCQPMAEKLAGR